MYLVGREMRQRYVIEKGLLNETFDPEQIEVRSVADQASVISAQAFFAGLFPEIKSATSEN